LLDVWPSCWIKIMVMSYNKQIDRRSAWYGIFRETCLVGRGKLNVVDESKCRSTSTESLSTGHHPSHPSSSSCHRRSKQENILAAQAKRLFS
jgi:hypothetical protein